MVVTKRASTLLLGLTLVVGCAPSPASDDYGEDAARIRARFDSALSAFEAERDPERAADIYLGMHTADAILMFPGAPAVEGPEAIRPFIVDFVRAYEFAFPDWTSEELVVSGNLAVHRFSGVAMSIPRSGGDTLREDRKYLDVWRKEADGEWRIARHIFNLNN